MGKRTQIWRLFVSFLISLERCRSFCDNFMSNIEFYFLLIVIVVVATALGWFCYTFMGDELDGYDDIYDDYD